MNFFAFFGFICRPRYPHTPLANGLVESQKKHRGQSIRITTQQINFHWSDQTDIYNFAHYTQTLIHSQFSANEKVFLKKLQVPIEFPLKNTGDQNKICISSFFRYLLTHQYNISTAQNKIVQPLLSKPLLTFTLHKEKSIFYVYFRQYLTIKERLLFKSEQNDKFGKEY